MEEELIYRYLAGDCTAEEEARLGAWYAENPAERQREIDRVRLVFESILVHRTIGRPGAARPSRLRFVVRRIASAAAVLALFAGGIWWMRLHTFTEISDRLTTIEVPAGQRLRMTLEDGSVVWLNAGAKIEYPVLFGRHERRVTLTGEALFEVEHDAARPFLVETFASQIEVLGTRFNVVADRAHNRFSTTLVRGRVKVTNRLDPSQPDVILAPGDIASLDGERLRVDAVKNSDALRWTEGILCIYGLPFDELMARFEQAYDIRIVIDRPTLPVIHYTGGKVRISDGIDHALRMLQRASDFTYTKDAENNVITIR